MKPSEALLKHRSDKVPFSKHGCHHYDLFYDELFEKMKEPLNILEIGVLRGQSLLAWRDCFPKSNVTGIDINHVDINPSLDIKFIKDDVKNIKLTEKYDVIIDDSSHDLKESTYIVSNFCENLTDNGVMVIEDIQIPDLYIQTLLKVLPKGFAFESYDFRHITNGQKHDDFIVKITRE